MKINEVMLGTVDQQRQQLSESLKTANVPQQVYDTHMSIFEAHHGEWQGATFDEVMAELDLADQEDGNI